MKIIFRNKISILGAFLITASIVTYTYNAIRFNQLNIIKASIDKIYIENEKTKSNFKYGKTNLNITYLYIELISQKNRFYISQNTGHTIGSQDLYKIYSKINVNNQVSIWIDKDEMNSYEDVEIHRLQIGNSVIIDNSRDYYFMISIIIGIILLLVSKNFLSDFD